VAVDLFSGTVPSAVLQCSPEGAPARLTHVEVHTIAAVSTKASE
jgi:hypothetical protein